MGFINQLITGLATSVGMFWVPISNYAGCECKVVIYTVVTCKVANMVM